MEKEKKKCRLSDIQIIALSFAAVILVGAALLTLPSSSADGTWSNPLDCLFTATSATCVTGLVVYDTPTHWSLMGQIVIISLIQVGGIGFMTLLTMVSFFLHHKVNMHQRRLLMQSTGALKNSGIMASFRQILLGTLVIEAVGAALLAIRFYPVYGKIGIWYSVFHSISAFCNAGFDLVGTAAAPSIIGYVGDPLVSGTLMFLIIMGGLGFLVWNDLLVSGFRPRKMTLHTKLVLLMTSVLLIGGTVILYVTDRNAAFAGLSEGDKWLAAAFQSVTTRTAGFASVDQATLSNSGSLISMILMFIGGSPGSTAGGVKTTTALVLLLSTVCLAQNKENVVVFRRRIENRLIRQAGAVIFLYMLGVLSATTFICLFEPAPLREVLYEVVSAIATVGLSMNLSPTLCAASKLILILLMYAGRLGGLSLFLALSKDNKNVPLERPTEKILLG